MSKYVEYNLSQIRNQEILLAALSELGWDSGKVEVHENPVVLYGYHGDARKEKAHIVIRRNNTGVGSSNDIGFVRDADGVYKPIISEYDQHACGRGFGNRTYGEPTLGLSQTLEKVYGRVAGDKSLDVILTKTLPRMKREGLVEPWATAATVPVTGGRAVQIRY